MNFWGSRIFTLTILLYVTVSQNNTTNSSFNTCYFNDQSLQCPSGEACAIAPPADMRVRRRAFYPEQDKQLSSETSFSRGETRRKGRSGGGGRSRGGRWGSPSKTGGSTGWRYGNSISQQSYGSSIAGATSRFTRFRRHYYWWNSSPSEYYRSRKNNVRSNLKENQGICIKKEALRKMTRQDCYNWCMSVKYNDNTCAKNCGMTKKDNSLVNSLIIAGLVLFGCAALVYYIKKANLSPFGTKL